MKTFKMHRIPILLLFVVHSVWTKFVEIELPLESYISKTELKKPPNVASIIDHNQRRHSNNHHNRRNSFFTNEPVDYTKYLNIDSMTPNLRRNKEYVKLNHVYGIHDQGESRRFSMKEAQDGLSSQERDHPGNSLFHLYGKVLLGAAKFPKRKPDDHSVYGNLQSLGLINTEKLFNEARAKRRPRVRPPDAARQPHLLFDRNHPGMTLVHPNEKVILGYAKFAQPSEASHRVYGNDHNIGFRSQDRTQPLRFQYSGFRRNFNKNGIIRSENPPQYNLVATKRNNRKTNGGWSPQFGKAHFSSPQKEHFYAPEQLSYQSLILRSRDSDEQPPHQKRKPANLYRLKEHPMKTKRISSKFGKKMAIKHSHVEPPTLAKPTHQKRKPANLYRLKEHPIKTKRISLKTLKSGNKMAKKYLRISQTIPPWVKVIEKESTETEKLKSKKRKILNDKLVYGHTKNIGIRYGNSVPPYRLAYSNFRRHHLWPEELPDSQPEDLQHSQPEDLQDSQPEDLQDSQPEDLPDSSEEETTHKKKKKRHYFRSENYPSSGHPVYIESADTSNRTESQKNPRRLWNNVLANLLHRVEQNEQLSSHTRNNKRNKQDLSAVLDAVMRAVNNAKNKDQYLYKRGPNRVALAALGPSDIKAQHLDFRPLDTYLKDSENDDSYEIEDGPREILEDGNYNTDYRRRSHKKKDKDNSYEIIDSNCTKASDSSSSESSSSGEKNPGNPYTLFKNKYKKNWLWNHFMDGNHMNINPYGPQFESLGPSGSELFFGRKWWYFNQDDYRPLGRR